MAFRFKETQFSSFRPLFEGALLACDDGDCDGGDLDDDGHSDDGDNDDHKEEEDKAIA